MPGTSFSDCCNVISIGPEFSSPQFSFGRWMPAKHLPCGDALEYPYDLSDRHLRMGTTQQMDVISIHSHPLNLNSVPLCDPFARLHDNSYHLRIQQRLPILNRKNNVVVYLPHTVIASMDGRWFFHTAILQNLSPCGKPQGICKFKYWLPDEENAFLVPVVCRAFAEVNIWFSRFIELCPLMKRLRAKARVTRIHLISSKLISSPLCNFPPPICRYTHPSGSYRHQI